MVGTSNFLELENGRVRMASTNGSVCTISKHFFKMAAAVFAKLSNKC